MGYKTDVYFTLPTKVYDQCYRLTIFKNANKVINYKNENNIQYKLIIWEGVKWQNYFEDIEELNKILDKYFNAKLTLITLNQQKVKDEYLLGHKEDLDE